MATLTPTTVKFVFRRLRGEADYAPIAEIGRLSNLADRVPFIESVEEVANTFTHLVNADPAHDVILAEVDGELVGYQRTWWRLDSDGTYLYNLAGHVAPAWRRQGLGRALFERGEQRLRAVAAQHPAEAPRAFQTFTSVTREGKVALVQQRGHAVVRHFYEMERPHLADLPPVQLPAGLELRPVQPEHLRLIWDANVEAFLDHWGAVALTDTDYDNWRNNPLNDFSLWQIAWDTATNQVAGVAINLIDAHVHVNEADNNRVGYVDDLSVRRPWRKRGLGRALLVASLHLFQARGMTTARLGVDAENPSGALGLYESVGFRQKEHSLALRKAF